MLDPGPSLLEAAPYIDRFRGQHVIVKIGGELLDRAPVLQRLAPQIVVLQRCGLRPVIVHGGGRQIDAACEARGISVQKRGGRRITSPEVLEVLLDVVARELNGRFCELLESANVRVRGFEDGASRAVRCRRRPPVAQPDGESVDFGEVGDVASVDPVALFGEDPADAASAAGASPRADVVPVLPSLGLLADDNDGGDSNADEAAPRWLNVNADSVAARVALALGAQKLVMLSRVPGVLERPGDAGPISQLDVAAARAFLAEKRDLGGMRAKLEEALNALAGGVKQVHIISGERPHTLLREIFTREGCGTLITA